MPLGLGRRKAEKRLYELIEWLAGGGPLADDAEAELDKIRTPESTSALISLLSDRPAYPSDPRGALQERIVRIRTIGLLGRRDSETVVPHLVRMLGDEAYYVRVRAAAALRSYGWEPSLAAERAHFTLSRSADERDADLEDFHGAAIAAGHEAIEPLESLCYSAGDLDGLAGVEALIRLGATAVTAGNDVLVEAVIRSLEGVVARYEGRSEHREDIRKAAAASGLIKLRREPSEIADEIAAEDARREREEEELGQLRARFHDSGDAEMVEVLSQLCVAYASVNEDAIRKLEAVATVIGEELNRRGGISEMRRVWNLLGNPPGARTLDMHWDGIGEWRG